MRRNGGHFQRTRRAHMVCVSCKQGNCRGCVDVTRATLGRDGQVCMCLRKEHGGDTGKLKDTLGHVHGERPKTDREKAIEQAGEKDTPEQAAEQLALAESDNDPTLQPGDSGDEDEQAF